VEFNFVNCKASELEKRDHTRAPKTSAPLLIVAHREGII
jgi:hypothetical protein